jgi:hypothetical protein
MDKDKIIDEGFFTKIIKGLKRDKSSPKVKKEKSKKLQKMYDEAEKEIEKTQDFIKKEFKRRGLPVPDYLK